jgi:hypothetical protein
MTAPLYCTSVCYDPWVKSTSEPTGLAIAPIGMPVVPWIGQ